MGEACLGLGGNSQEPSSGPSGHPFPEGEEVGLWHWRTECQVAGLRSFDSAMRCIASLRMTRRAGMSEEGDRVGARLGARGSRVDAGLEEARFSSGG